MAKEKNLTTVTSVAAADFVRVVTSAGATVKSTMENLAKSLLTTSFSGLSLGGSQQSVKDALDSLNSNSVIARGATYTGDLNDLKTPGYWYATSSATNFPEGYTAAHVLVFANNGRVIQLAFSYNGKSLNARTSADSGSSWGAWYQI